MNFFFVKLLNFHIVKLYFSKYYMSIDSKDIVSISDNDWSLVRLSLLLGDPEIKEEKMIVF